jgi:hypothetical protein
MCNTVMLLLINSNMYHIRNVKHLLVNKTYQRAHITLQYNFGGYFVGVIFGYIYHYAKPTAAKCIKVIRHFYSEVIKFN